MRQTTGSAPRANVASATAGWAVAAWLGAAAGLVAQDATSGRPGAVSLGAPAGLAAQEATSGPEPADARAAASATPTRHVFTRPLMGTEFRIVVHAADADAAGAAAERAFARVAGLERVLSDYDPDSELSRLAAAAGGDRTPVSDDLWAVLAEAAAWSGRTDGAFDITVGPLTRVWRRAARRGTVPTDEEVAAARAAVGHRLLELDPATRSVRLSRPGMRLDAGGIGKGYAADAALELLAEAGFPSAMVDAGGDVVAGDPPPGEDGWRVALPGRPGCVVPLARAALATSGDAARSVEAGGAVHSHVLDPRTGRALTHRRTVTVLAPTATAADALASALSVLDLDEGRDLVDALPGVRARVVGPDADPVPCSIPHSCPEPS